MTNFAPARRFLAEFLSVALLFTSFSVNLEARPVSRTRTWEELAATITTDRVRLVLPDGTS